MRKRIGDCGKWVHIVADTSKEKQKVHKANNCENRFCPICAWKQAQEDAMKIAVMMDYLTSEHGLEYIMVTLTAPNVSGDSLSDEITRFNKGFNVLCKRDEIMRMNRGCVRKLEITYDANPDITHEMWFGDKDKHIKARKEYYKRRGLKIRDKNPNYDTYHTHFHCLFAVNKSYFTSRDYVKQETWLGLWRGVMGDASITQVDVRRVKVSVGSDVAADGREGKTISKGSAANEAAKYAAKDTDYMVSEAVFDTFYNALKGRQVLTYSGMFKDANAKYKDKELEEYKRRDATEYCYMLLYSWGNGEYIEKNCRELNEEEKMMMNN
jgi:plasmid rolling circle replication initiator protein Rep